MYKGKEIKGGALHVLHYAPFEEDFKRALGVVPHDIVDKNILINLKMLVFDLEKFDDVCKKRGIKRNESIAEFLKRVGGEEFAKFVGKVFFHRD